MAAVEEVGTYLPPKGKSLLVLHYIRLHMAKTLSSFNIDLTLTTEKLKDLFTMLDQRVMKITLPVVAH